MTLSSTSDSTVDDTSHNQNISRIPLPYIPLTTINTVPHRPLSTPPYWRVRMSGKIKRSLSDEDFTARHKFSFDIIGNELTPSAKYDFKFKDYAPWVFRTLREDSFQLDPADYLLSLTSKYILSELGSPGKSGSFFYFSRDFRFIIKTIRPSTKRWSLFERHRPPRQRLSHALPPS